jgi:hypothetical protein
MLGDVVGAGGTPLPGGRSACRSGSAKTSTRRAGQALLRLTPIVRYCSPGPAPNCVVTSRLLARGGALSRRQPRDGASVVRGGGDGEHLAAVNACRVLNDDLARQRPGSVRYAMDRSARRAAGVTGRQLPLRLQAIRRGRVRPPPGVWRVPSAPPAMLGAWRVPQAILARLSGSTSWPSRICKDCVPRGRSHPPAPTTVPIRNERSAAPGWVRPSRAHHVAKHPEQE